MAVLETEKRPWGSFDVLIDDPHTKVKRITVLPGEILSLQSHQRRMEHWTVVKGVATVTVNEVTKEYGYGEHVFIPQGSKHRLANMSTETIEVVEVQLGDYFGEDDIVRYEDKYKRT
jgi:mannose-6-phosphate isomerase-like protein (cupin superfamily)